MARLDGMVDVSSRGPVTVTDVERGLKKKKERNDRVYCGFFCLDGLGKCLWKRQDALSLSLFPLVLVHTYSGPVHDPGIIHDDIQPAERLHARVDGSLPVLAFGRVAGESHCNHHLAVHRLIVERRSNSLAILGVNFEKQDASSFRDEFASNAFAESLAGAGDDCFFVEEAALGDGHGVGCWLRVASGWTSWFPIIVATPVLLRWIVWNDEMKQAERVLWTLPGHLLSIIAARSESLQRRGGRHSLSIQYLKLGQMRKTPQQGRGRFKHMNPLRLVVR
jgi:hypothetical protein